MSYIKEDILAGSLVVKVRMSPFQPNRSLWVVFKVHLHVPGCHLPGYQLPGYRCLGDICPGKDRCPVSGWLFARVAICPGNICPGKDLFGVL